MPKTALLKSDEKDNLSKTRSLSLMATNLHSPKALIFVLGSPTYSKVSFDP